MLIEKIKYVYAKLVTYIQIPAIRNSKIDKRSWIGHRSNLINVTIGRYSYVGVNNSICNCNIGSFCSIGSYCAIGGGVHPLDKLSTSPVFYDRDNCFHIENFIASSHDCSKTPIVTLGNDVWVGENCFIKAGITIGDGVIVGAHSVITKDIPPYAIVAGIPAKIIRYRFSEEKIKDLLEMQWWNWNDSKIQANLNLFR